VNDMAHPLRAHRTPASAGLRCVVHIGAPKTGSTWLQKVFTENRTVLAERGILYPDVSLRGFGHHDLAFLLSGGYPDWATPQPRSLGELEQELARATRDHNGAVLISSEDFYLYPNPAGLRAMLERSGLPTPTIVVYVRRQDAAHESWYNQTIKAQGYTHDIETCIAQSFALWDYAAQLQKWSDVFGRESLRVRVYDPSVSLLTDFADASGLDLQGISATGDALNTGLNRDVLEFQRIVNGLPLPIVEKRRFHKQLIALSTATRGTGLFDEGALLSRTRRRALIAAYANGNANVAHTYLGRDTLFDETVAEEDAGAPSGLTSEKLARILGWLMAKGGAHG
jgi:hypothetical protein